MPDRQDGLLGSRYAKLERLRQRGIDPYPPRYQPTTPAAAAIAEFETWEERGEADSDAQQLAVAGRIVSLRAMGRASFLDLRDGSGTIQALLRQNVLGEDYALLEDLDLGDFLGVSGTMMRTRTGQPTIEAHQITLLAKGLRPLPEKWHGLRDVEIRYRQRYLDLIANPDIAGIFAQRSRVIRGIRSFLDARGFMEVETPILVPVAAGAHARPFITHHNALDQQLYLRIATELYLKRLIVGGFDKVYELGRVFRNEGIDQDHNPEFSLLESYEEVETPILVSVAAGAHARPFITHHNALDQQLYLRIATELYLKRLIVGGVDKVYELGRVFRNEGIDQDHNPEFSLLESYEAYADYTQVMEMVESLFATVAQEVRGTTQIPYGEHVIDFSPPWPRLSLREELERRSGIDLDEFPDDAALVKRVASLGLDIGPRESRGRLIDKLISTFVEPNLIQPTFLLDYPEEMSPLAKAKPGCPGYVERFEAFAAGMEVANSYSELNDPAVQRDRFEAQEEVRQIYQDEEVDRRDDDFLLAMEYGMPPTGGLGVGIDRMVMLLTGQTSIRDVLLFPQMRTLRPGEEAGETEEMEGSEE